MRLDALGDRGLRRINNGIAHHSQRAHSVSFRLVVRQCCCTGLVKISPDFLSKKQIKKPS